jgi:hypothetical protein
MLGDADATLQLILAQQQAQAGALKRIAFWQSLGGGLAIGATVLSVAIGVATYVRSRR